MQRKAEAREGVRGGKLMDRSGAHVSAATACYCLLLLLLAAPKGFGSVKIKLCVVHAGPIYAAVELGHAGPICAAGDRPKNT